MGKILAIDYGKKRTGVAISDASRKYAFAREPIIADNPAGVIAAIRLICETESVEMIIVGRPLPMSAKVRGRSIIDEVEVFAGSLRAHLRLDVVLEDERLTTKMANKILHDAQKTGAAAKRARDSIAAALLLQSFLDRGGDV